MMFLSGLFFPVDTMPKWIRPVVDAMPLTYLADALRQIMVGATPLHPLGIDLLVLTVWLGDMRGPGGEVFPLGVAVSKKAP